MYEQKCLCGKVLYQVGDNSTLPETIECQHCHRVRPVKWNPENMAAAEAKKAAKKKAKKNKKPAATDE